MSLSKTLSHFTTFFYRYRWYFLVLILVIPAIKDLLLPGYFPMHDDLQILRIEGMDQCIRDLQIPCRWIPDAGFGLGYPMFNYYPPLPFYVAETFHLLGLSSFWAIKLVFILAFVLPALFMFLLASEFFGPIGGVVAATFYTYAPYHSVDIYVRGALNEAWGLIWFPLVFYASYKIIISKTKISTLGSTILLAVSYSALLTSHNIMTLIFSPLLGLWTLFWLIVTKGFVSLKPLILAGIWSIGLAAFFFLPVVAEKKFAHVETMTVGYFNYLAHYSDINQMFISRFWGYGGSTWGPNDDMAFPIGHFHWGLSLVAAFLFLAVCMFYLLFKGSNPKHFRLSILGILLGTTTLFYIFLIHSKSIWFWDHLPLLYYAQFPWRLLAIPAFTFSFLASSVFLFIPRKLKLDKILAILLILGVILWNLSFFHIQKSISTTLQEKMTGYSWELQTTGGIFDYLPKTASRPPGSPGQIYPEFIKGSGGITKFHKGTNHLEFEVIVSSDIATLQLPILEYPNWVIKTDGKLLPHTYDSDLGRVEISLTKGPHQVTAKLHNTPIRTFSNFLTLFSLVLLIQQLSILKKQRDNKKKL